MATIIQENNVIKGVVQGFFGDLIILE